MEYKNLCFKEGIEENFVKIERDGYFLECEFLIGSSMVENILFDGIWFEMGMGNFESDVIKEFLILDFGV